MLRTHRHLHCFGASKMVSPKPVKTWEREARQGGELDTRAGARCMNYACSTDFYVGFAGLLFIVLALTIITSIMMYYLVEESFIKLSNKYRLWEKYE